MGIGIRTTMRSVMILTTVAISKRASSFEHPLPSVLVQYRWMGLKLLNEMYSSEIFCKTYVHSNTVAKKKAIIVKNQCK
jgi:hypothetical protein